MNLVELGTRVRRLRIASGLGQVEFAQAIGIGSGSVSMIENGRMPVSDELADAIARTLRCTVAFLHSPAGTPLMSQPLLRAYADAPKKAVDRQVADATVAIELVHALGLQTMADAMPTWHGDLSSEEDIEQFAQDVRAAAQVGDGAVVGNTIRAAERLGCIVLPMPEELGRHLGMSVRIDINPVLFASRASLSGEGSVPGDRQRFTVAHELGHLGLHSHLGPPETAQDAALLESQAHRFAGAFLAPGDAMLEELSALGGRVTLQTLASIKERWGVAIKALVMRFRSLGVIDAEHARSLYKQISARGWNRSEPVPVGPESAIWLERALIKRVGAGPRSLQVAAARVGLDVSHLQRWTDWSVQETDAQVLALPQRGARQPGRTGKTASVSRLGRPNR